MNEENAEEIELQIKLNSTKELLLEFCKIKEIIQDNTTKLDILKPEIESHLLDSQDNKIFIDGYTLELRKSSNYDYNTSKHPMYNAIANRMAKLDIERKKLEAFLQNIPIKGVKYKLESGEEVMLFPPNKTTTNKIYFKK